MKRSFLTYSGLSNKRTEILGNLSAGTLNRSGTFHFMLAIALITNRNILELTYVNREVFLTIILYEQLC